MDVVETCERKQQVTEMMSLALDGLLDEAGRQRLQQHLDTCPACQAEWQAMQTVSTLFERSALVGPPLGFAVRVERRLETKQKKRRRTFGGVAVLTSSLSLAGVTVAAVCLIVLGIVAWQWLGDLQSVQVGLEAASQVASGMGLVGKGASLFLGDLLLRYGAPLLFALGAGVAVLVGLWTWFFVRRPKSPHNGYAN
ncbi:MAG: zf-HC2 domain-containing protein [Anaerolineae bacterium]|jgi:anti-sigma factor RsiW